MKQIRGEPLRGGNVVVVGAGRSGVAAARLAAAAGAEVLLLERNPAVLDEATTEPLRAEGIACRTGEHEQRQFMGADLVILSPGIPPGVIRKLLPEEGMPRLLSEMELGWWFVDRPVVAVTGSNGKTTTVGLISCMLQEAGVSSFAGGNIGSPLSDYALQGLDREVLVLEVSSFQMLNTPTFRPDVGVLLNFSPNHLDYHGSLEEYFEAKMALFQKQESRDLAILPQEMRTLLGAREDIRARREYFTAEDRFDCPGLLGEHNQANMEAAYLASRPFGVTEAVAREAVRRFRPEPHRLQPLGEQNGVLFVNDSKGTTLVAQEAALHSFSRPILLLAGGRLKGDDPARQADLIRSRVKAAGVFGECRDQLERAWRESTRLFCEESMEAALDRLMDLARTGDVVLFSPGTSSFDQYQDYKERGRAFQALVNRIGDG
ncbi:MAG: UDP-N-acetylmuramoyl-L-alanine--D-glutamate ligase [Desulfohalobiaceae bacterium]|nr:UDP-N-acetylmuramoyl-L-alanine--D-glutamate ligase [Desulfohalobiaceae bacterium]